MDDSDYDPEVEEVQDGIDRPTSENNPIRMAERESIFPSFLNTPDKAENNRQNNRNNLAKKDLKKSEKNASVKKDGQKKDKDDAAINKILDLEKKMANPASGIVNAVKGKDKDKKGGKKKGTFKKAGATFMLLGTIFCGIAGVSFFGQALQPFAYVNNIIQNFNSPSYSMTARFNTTLYSMMDGKAKASNEMKVTLKQTGIDVETDSDGKVKSLSYDSDGETKVITNKTELADALENDDTFASKTAKAGELVDTDSFFGRVKTAVAERIGWVKNRWQGTETDEEVKAKFDDVAADANAASSGTSTKHYYKEEVDDDGNVTQKPLTEAEYEALSDADKKTCKIFDESDVNVKPNAAEAEADIKKIVDVDESGEITTNMDVEGLASKVSSAGKYASGALCAYSAIAQAVSTVLMANQIIKMINLASGFFESVQKCQAGDGTCNVMHEYLGRMNMGDFWSAVSIQSLFGSETAKKQSVSSGNLEHLLNDKGILGSITSKGASAGSWKTCTTSRLIAAGADFVSDIIGVVLSGGLLTIVKKVVKSAVFAVGVSVGISIASRKLVEYAIKELGFDPILDMKSRASGDYTTGGGHSIFSYIGKGSGLSIGTDVAIQNFAQYKDTVLAQRAKYDQDNLSPFDITSKNTFLGSMVNSAVSFAVLNASGSTPLMNMLSSVSSVASSSILGLLPEAAASTYENYTSAVGECPLLDDIGARGDANHCIDYTISDVDSFPVSYEEAVKYLCDKDELDCNSSQDHAVGSYTVNKVTSDSDKALPRYIRYWMNRDSHPGLYDGSIQADFEWSTGSKVGDAIVGVIPIFGSAVDYRNAKAVEENAGIISGSDYNIGGEHWETEKQLYDSIEAYVEMDPMYEQLGLVETSAIANYIDEYRQENPVDYSREGTIARFSGLTKEAVVETLAYIDYLNDVDNYDPLDRYAFAEESEQYILVDGGDTNNQQYISLNEIYYFDLRTKNFAI